MVPPLALAVPPVDFLPPTLFDVATPPVLVPPVAELVVDVRPPVALLPPLGNGTLVAEPPSAPPLALLVIGSRPPEATPPLVDEPPMFCVAPPPGVADAEPVTTWPP